MRQVMVSVFDVAAGVYARPWFCPSLGIAMRTFGDEAVRADPSNPLYSHPADFQLYHLGDFDDEQGRFQLLDIPVRIAVATQFRSLQ